MFDDYPSYDLYRTLKDVTPDDDPMSGEDCYALQCALKHVLKFGLDTHEDFAIDGSIGPDTGKAIWQAQNKLGIIEDGLAGQETQRALALRILGEQLRPWTTRYLLVLGIILKESSGWLGIYSEQRPNGSYDAGVTQQNTEHNDPAEAFDPTKAIPKLARYTVEGLKLYEDRSKFVGSDHSRHRRLCLAAGRWNAPAYTGWLAGVGHPNDEPGPTARAAIENYMLWATKLVDEK